MQKVYLYQGERNILAKFPLGEVDGKPIARQLLFKTAPDEKTNNAILSTDDKSIQKIIEESSAFNSKVIVEVNKKEDVPTPSAPSGGDNRFAEISSFNEAVAAIKEAYEIEDHALVGSKAKLKAFALENDISLPLIFPSEG